MANNTFLGTIDSYSSKAGNWSLGVVPTIGDGNVVLISNSFVNMVLDADLSFDDLNITTTSNKTISTSGGYKLTVTNSVSKSNNATIVFDCDTYVKGNLTSFSGTGYYQIKPGKFLYFNGNTTIGDIRLRGDGTIKYLSGTITHTGTLILFTGSLIFDTNGDTTPGCTTTSSTGINWNNMNLFSSSNYANSGLTPIRVVNNLLFDGVLCGFTSGTKVYVGGSFTSTQSTQSSAWELHLDGTGMFDCQVNMRHSLYFEPSCNITLNNNLILSSNQSKIYSSSGCNVSPNGYSVIISITGVILQTAHINWYRVYINNNSLTLNSNADDINTDIFEFITTTNIVILSQNINCKQLIVNSTGTGYLRSNYVINVSENLYLRGGGLNGVTAYLYLNLSPTATQDVIANANFVDSSGGKTILTGINNTLTSTINWYKKQGSMAFALTNKI